MKGLSPVIATVMLIGITVGVLAVVAIWFPGLISSQTETTQVQSENVIACSGVRIGVERVTNGTIAYSNTNIRTITNITIFDEDGRNITSTQTSLTPGQVGNLTWSRGNNQSILLTGICESAIVVRGECKAGWDCWE